MHGDVVGMIGSESIVLCGTGIVLHATSSLLTQSGMLVLLGVFSVDISVVEISVGDGDVVAHGLIGITFIVLPSIVVLRAVSVDISVVDISAVFVVVFVHTVLISGLSVPENIKI